MKFRTRLGNFALLLLILAAGCKKDDFNEIIGICPLVVSTNPVNGATSVPLDQVITVTFNTPMNPSTITLNTITVNGPVVISGRISYSGFTATFVPIDPLEENTIYTGRVTQAVKDTRGNALQTDYVWTFSTGILIGPLVISTSPANNEGNVLLSKVISATFNMEMDSTTINETSFIIKNGFSSVDGSITYSGNTAYFTPTSPLVANTTYTGILTTRIKNLAGVSLSSDYIWTFNTLTLEPPTIISTDPTDNETNVILAKRITATFSVPMLANTISTSSFIVKQGTSIIPGTVSYTGTTASFVPTNSLQSNTTYTATITNAVRNLAGTAMVDDYVWTFSTGLIIIPTVIATDPLNNETSVLLNKVVTATFSMAMNPLTINTSSFTLKQGQTTVAGTVSYFGTTASFTPAIPLLANKIYTATITTSVRNLAGTAIAADYIWSFTTVNNIPPTVIATDPINNATNVVLAKIITATFSVPMDPSTINSSSFIVRQGGILIPGIILYSGVTASFIPSINLKSNTLYSVTITTNVKNVAGISLATNYNWSFTTITIPPPTVTSTSPVNNETGVQLNKQLTANFSTSMDPATINSSSFILYEGIIKLSGIVTYSGITATFKPSATLKANTVYTATITTLAKNVAGVALVSNYVWTFTTIANPPPTVISTDPLNNASGVLLNKQLTANFSTAMDPATINSSTFLLSHAGIPVSGVVSYSGITAKFIPNNLLTSNTVYTATITTGAKNLAGIALVANYQWSFTTITLIPPTVVSTDPSNNEISVVFNKTLTAVFSEIMDPLTINATSFLLFNDLNPVTGIVNYSGVTASFNPTVDLLPNTLYTARITTAAKSFAGIPLENDYNWSFTTKLAGAPFVDLNSVARFGIIAGAGISNNAGFSEIHDMDIGISPGFRSSVTGFPPGIVVNGAIFAADDIAPPGVAAMLIQAKNDLTAAYNFARGASVPAPIIVSGDQGGKTLAPGIYKSTSTLLIAGGDLTLDAQGDPNAVWIFQIGSSFTSIGGAGGSIILSGGAQANNIFWQVSSSATIGDFTSFQGNVLALTSITMNSGATADGRMLCINGAVVLTSTNIINKP